MTQFRYTLENPTEKPVPYPRDWLEFSQLAVRIEHWDEENNTWKVIKDREGFL